MVDWAENPVEYKIVNLAAEAGENSTRDKPTNVRGWGSNVEVVNDQYGVKKEILRET